MPQNAVATATTASQAFPAGTQAGGQYRFRATSAVPVVTTLLRDTPDATFVGLAAGTYTFDAVRLGVDGITLMGTMHSVAGVVITDDVLVTTVTALALNVQQV